MEERRALIEVLDRDGAVRARHPVTAWPVRIGRAFDCDVVLDDAHVAPHHAELAPDAEGRLVVRALPSLNGLRVGERRVAPGEAAELASGGLIMLGQCALRLRQAGEALAPERPLPRVGARALAADLALGAGALAVAAADAWIDLEPGTKLSEPLAALLGAIALLLAWAGAWGLASKLFRHHFAFLPHLRLALWFVIALHGVDALLHLLAFSLSWGLPSRLAPWAQVACGFALVRGQVNLLVPAARRAVTRTALVLFAGALAVSMAATWQHGDRLFSELYTATLGPPALRLGRAVAPAELLREARGLREVLDRRAREDAAEEAEGAGEE